MDEEELADGLDQISTRLSRGTRYLPKSMFWPITTFRCAVEDRLENFETTLETLFERASL